MWKHNAAVRRCCYRPQAVRRLAAAVYLLCQLLRVLSVDAVGVKLCSHLIDLLTQHVFDSPHILAGDRVELLLQLLDIRRHVGLILVVLPQQTQKTTAPL